MFADQPDRERVEKAMHASIALGNALRRGDLQAARQALGDPPDWPNSVDGYLHSSVLSAALGWAPLDTIRELLTEGADPNFTPLDDGFPSLIDVMHHRLSKRPELPHWDDGHEVLEALLAAGADPDRRGLNDWTALHFAAAADDPVAVRMLLAAGADPNARTRIDDCETPLEIAQEHSPRALSAFVDWPVDTC
jgi:ankyrin repeat protein